MKTLHQWLGVSLCATVMAATSAFGQPPSQSVPDPTQPSAKMREALATQTPGVAAIKMPVVVLKGRIIAKGRPPLAIVEIDGKPRTVTAGTEITIAGAQKLTCVEITPGEVRLECNAPKGPVNLN